MNIIIIIILHSDYCRATNLQCEYASNTTPGRDTGEHPQNPSYHLDTTRSGEFASKLPCRLHPLPSIYVTSTPQLITP